MMATSASWLGFTAPTAWGDLGGLIGGIATFVAAVVAVIAAFYARAQIMESRKIQGEILAQQTYAAYLLKAFEHPEFSGGYTDSSDAREFERYEWFVSYLLNACDGIMMYLPNDKQWEACVAAQLEYHLDYIKNNNWFKKNYALQYSDRLVAVIDRVKAN